MKVSIIIFIACLFIPSYLYGPDTSQKDIDLFKLLVQQSESKGLWDKREMGVYVRIDPRLFLGNPSGPEGMEFVETDLQKLELRNKIIEEYDVVPADILKDKICQSTRGLQPPPEIGENKITQEIDPYCESLGNFVTIAFGEPERCSSNCQNDIEIEEEEMNGELFTIRAVEISGYTLGVFRLLVLLSADGDWEYVDKTTLLLVLS